MANLSGGEGGKSQTALSLSLSIRALALNYITTATPNGERRRRAPLGRVVFAYTDTATPGHDGCLYEAVIYFIIGGSRAL